MILHHLPFDSSAVSRGAHVPPPICLPRSLCVVPQKAFTVPAGLVWKEKEVGILSAGQLNRFGALQCLHAAIRRFADGDVETIKQHVIKRWNL